MRVRIIRPAAPSPVRTTIPTQRARSAVAALSRAAAQAARAAAIRPEAVSAQAAMRVRITRPAAPSPVRTTIPTARARSAAALSRHGAAAARAATIRREAAAQAARAATIRRAAAPPEIAARMATTRPAAPSPVRATTPTLRVRSAEALSHRAAQRPSAAARPGSAGTTSF